MVFLQGPSGLPGRLHNHPTHSSIIGSPLQAQALRIGTPPQHFTPMPTFIIRALVILQENNLIYR